MDDPYTVLGVEPGAQPSELAAAYREQAKRWHPDRNEDAESERRMAAGQRRLRPPAGGRDEPEAELSARRRRRRGGAAAWLPAAVRRALGSELLEALEPGEEVRHVTPTATWASARALLVVTDRRLLWLLDDAVTARVQSLRFSRIASHPPPAAPPAPPRGDPARGERRRQAARVRRAAPADRGGDRAPRQRGGGVMDDGARDRRGLAVLATGHLWADFLQGAVPALLPFLIAERGYSYAAAGALVLASSIGSSLVQPLFGIASDRFSLPWLMPAGLAIGGAGLATVGLTESYAATVAAVAVSGLGVAAFHPEGARYANYVSRGQRGRGMSMFSLGGNAGFALGPLLVTPAVLAFGLHGTLLALIPLWLAAGLLARELGAAARLRARRGGRRAPRRRRDGGARRVGPVRAPRLADRPAVGRVLRAAGVHPDLLRGRARHERGGRQRRAERDARRGGGRDLCRRAARRPARAARDRRRLDGARSVRCSCCSSSPNAGPRRCCSPGSASS